MTRITILSLTFLLLAANARGEQVERTVTKLAEGVFEIEHRVGKDQQKDGNTTVIIGARQVLVVDTCFHPSAAKEDIAQIRQWTDKPVSFVLNTHFHNDHNLGNRAYMDAFPALTIIAHAETKRSMDMFGPGSRSREQKSLVPLQTMLATGKTANGENLSDEDMAMLRQMVPAHIALIEELRPVTFQSATLAFEHNFTIDLGDREVQVKYLGRGNTAGDAVVFLPRERVAIAGDLVVYPVPNIFDGYPYEWVDTLEKFEALHPATVVPGHGPVMHDLTYVSLVHELLKSARDQVDAKLSTDGPPMAMSFADMKTAVDLTPFRDRFAHTDDERAKFDYISGVLVKLLFDEASLR